MIRKRPPPWSSGAVSRSDAGQWLFILTWLSWLGTLHAMWNVAWEEPTFHCLNVSCFQCHIPPFRLSCCFLVLSLTESCSIVHLNVSGNCATSGPKLRNVGHGLLIVCGNGWHGLMKVSPILRWIQVAYWPLRSWQSNTNVSLILKFQTHSNGLPPSNSLGAPSWVCQRRRCTISPYLRPIFYDSDKAEKLATIHFHQWRSNF